MSRQQCDLRSHILFFILDARKPNDGEQSQSSPLGTQAHVQSYLNKHDLQP